MQDNPQDHEQDNKRLPGERICHILTFLGLFSVIGFGGFHIASDVRAANEGKVETVPQELPDTEMQEEQETENEEMPEEETLPLLQDTTTEGYAIPDSTISDTLIQEDIHADKPIVDESERHKTDSTHHHTDSISPTDHPTGTE